MSKEGLPLPDYLTTNDIQRNNAQQQSTARNIDELENDSSTMPIYVTSNIPLERINRNTNHRSDPTDIISLTQSQGTDTDNNIELYQGMRRFDTAPSNARSLHDILEEVIRIADDVLIDIPDTYRGCDEIEGSRLSPVNVGDRSSSQNQHENDHQPQQPQQQRRQ